MAGLQGEQGAVGKGRGTAVESHLSGGVSLLLAMPFPLRPAALDREHRPPWEAWMHLRGVLTGVGLRYCISHTCP